MKLLHLANLTSTNVGNGALILGAEKVLQEDLGSNITFERLPWTSFTHGPKKKKFDETFVETINASDGIIIGGAVTFNGQKKYANAGMRFDLSFPLWEKIKKPLIFYGISYRNWPGQHYHHRAALLKALTAISNNPNMLLGLRNDGTKEWLSEAIGFNSDRAFEVPDPALFVPTREFWHPELDPNRINILISLNNEDPIYRYSGSKRELTWKLLEPLVGEAKLSRFWNKIPKWDRRRNQMIRELAGAMKEISQRYPVRFVLCPHYLEDHFLNGQLLEACDSKLRDEAIVSTGQVGLEQTEYFYDLYAQADLAISMRVHSMSPAIGMSTPVVPLVSQTRMWRFLEKMNLDSLGIDIFSNDIKNQVLSKVTNILEDKNTFRNRLQIASTMARENVKSFNKLVANVLASC